MTSIQEISRDNISILAHLATQLWTDTHFDEMSEHFEEVLLAEHPTAFLLLQDQKPIGFIELSVRQDYVEGAEDMPVAYVEGIYVDNVFRKKGLASNSFIKPNNGHVHKDTRNFVQTQNLPIQAVLYSIKKLVSKKLEGLYVL
jgi:hypothetical protein